MGRTRIRLFQCPSAPTFEHLTGDYLQGGSILGLHTYHTLTNITTHYWVADYVQAHVYKYLAHTNYLGVAGCGVGLNPEFSRYQGIYTNRSRVSLSN
ncbi:MAG TPA: hypothetical protein PKA06_02380, partial [Gemmatales bacterium]|nr:hypothetical protein [Gemmatales bacterium]